MAALARRQYGVVSLAQLTALGITQRSVHRRLAGGRLHRIHRGVYAVGHTALTEEGRLLAAVLACGPRAALSHDSAGRRWRFVKRIGWIEVTCERSRPPGRGIVVHRSQLTAEDVVLLDGIPVTTVARTIVDLADTLTQRQLEDVINEAEVKRIFDLNEVDRALERVGARRGRHKLERALAAWRPRPFTRSDAEAWFFAMCERHGLPRPQINVWLLGMEVDFYWPRFGLVIETDGGGTHMTRRAFVEDRRRDRVLTAHGLRVMRVPWDDMQGDGAELAAQILAAEHAVAPAAPASFG